MGQLRKIAFLLAVGLSVAAIGCGSSDDLPGTSSSAPDDAAAAATDGATSGGTAPANGDGAAADGALSAGDKLYIARTGGVGVSLRDDCLDSARRGGAIPERSEVTLIRSGSAEACEEWSQVLSASGATWVRDIYLTSERPANVVRSTGAGGGTSSGGTSGSSGASSGAALIEAIDIIGHHVPLTELRVQTASWVDITNDDGTTMRIGCIKDHWRAIGNTVITTRGLELDEPDPSGCGFGVLTEVTYLRVPASE